MTKKVRWICQEYRGLFVHALAFKVAQLGEKQPLGPKWGYLIAVREMPGFDDEMPLKAPA